MKTKLSIMNRTHNISLFLFNLIVLLLIVSCSKNDSNLKIENPEAQGKTWTYLDYNYELEIYDTITIIQYGETELNNGTPVSKLIYKYPTIVDTNFIYIRPDTIMEFYTRSGNSCLYAYLLPLEKGKYWIDFNGAMEYDSTIVTNEINVEVFPNEWYNGFELQRIGFVGFDGGFDFIEIYVPEIGLIERYPTFEMPGEIYLRRKLLHINFTPSN
ncbi:MAG: hypothetical protein GQ564_22800 [Bacteroidales bacterium]|nr:hypothetical protein [Bacteroidales bacterium]